MVAVIRAAAASVPVAAPGTALACRSAPDERTERRERQRASAPPMTATATRAVTAMRFVLMMGVSSQPVGLERQREVVPLGRRGLDGDGPDVHQPQRPLELAQEVGELAVGGGGRERERERPVALLPGGGVLGGRRLPRRLPAALADGDVANLQALALGDVADVVDQPDVVEGVRQELAQALPLLVGDAVEAVLQVLAVLLELGRERQRLVVVGLVLPQALGYAVGRQRGEDEEPDAEEDEESLDGARFHSEVPALAEEVAAGAAGAVGNAEPCRRVRK